MGIFDWIKSGHDAIQKKIVEDNAERARRQQAAERENEQRRQEQQRERERQQQAEEETDRQKAQEQAGIKAEKRAEMLEGLFESSRIAYHALALITHGRRSHFEEKFQEKYVNLTNILFQELGSEYGAQALCLRFHWEWLEGVGLTLREVLSGPSRTNPRYIDLLVDARAKAGNRLDTSGKWDARLVYETSVLPYIPTDMRTVMEYAAGTRNPEGVPTAEASAEDLFGIRQNVMGGIRAAQLLREGGHEMARTKLNVEDPDGFLSRVEPLLERFGPRGGLLAYIAWLYEDDIGCKAWPIIGGNTDRFFDPDGKQLLARIERHMPAAVLKIIDDAAHASPMSSTTAPHWTAGGFFLGAAPPRDIDEGGPLRVPAGYVGEGNLLTVAPPGGGKSQCHVLPNVLAYAGPMVVLDIKRAENFHATVQAFNAMVVDQHCLRFDPAAPDQSVIYNPLEFLPASFDALWTAAGRMAEWLCIPTATSTDGGYFDDRARQWARGLIAAIVLRARSATPPTVPDLGELVDFVFDDIESQERFLGMMELMPHKALANLAKNILNTDDKERRATMNTLARSIEPWQDPTIQKLTSGRSTWKPGNLLVRKPVTRCGHIYPGYEGSIPRLKGISSDATLRGDEATEYGYPRFFICMPAGDVKASTSVVRVLIGQHIDTLMEREHRPEDRPIAFLLDEFPQLGRMDSILRGVEMGRASGLRFWFFAQDLQQISRSYDVNDEGTILGSCAVQSFMNINTLETAEAVSRRVGESRNAFTGEARAMLPAQDLLNSPAWRDKIICLRRQEPPLVLDKGMVKDMLLPAEPAERAMEEILQAARNEAERIMAKIRAHGTDTGDAFPDEVLQDYFIEHCARENAVDAIADFFLKMTKKQLPEDLAQQLKDEFRWIYQEADRILERRDCDNGMTETELTLLVDQETSAISIAVGDRPIPLGGPLTLWVNFGIAYCMVDDISDIQNMGTAMLDLLKILQIMATYRKNGILVNITATDEKTAARE